MEQILNQILRELIEVKANVNELSGTVNELSTTVNEIKQVQADHGNRLDRIERKVDRIDVSLEGIREQAATTSEDMTSLRLVHKKE